MTGRQHSPGERQHPDRIQPLNRSSPPRPLEGITVVDMGQVLAAPFATYLLHLAGADVIKIEPRGGEWLRQVDSGLAFATQNAGKRCISINMRAPGAAETVLRLVEHADVFVEGFAPGTAEAMGLGWETVSGRNPQVVYGSLSAFGDSGPYANRPGFDHVVQAMSGIMPATGFEGQPPTKVGAPFLDYGGGMLLAFGLMMGLAERQRTGRAVRIDTTMLDAGLLLNAGAVVRAATTGADPPRTGNNAFSGAVASGAFDTADGLLMVAANKPSQFQRLIEVLDLPELDDGPELALPGADPERVDQARRLLRECFALRPADVWETELNAAGIPAARVRTLSEVTSEGHTAARTILQSVPDPAEDAPNRSVSLPGLGVRINGVMPGPVGSATRAGAETRAVLAEFGFSPDEILGLLEDGTVFEPAQGRIEPTTE
ncbi:MAG: CoA transferase [Acidimicrobiia bacterium]|nr:CoA transferase [Acidimicrobiia bacterium]